MEVKNRQMNRWIGEWLGGEIDLLMGRYRLIGGGTDKCMDKWMNNG